jgi:RIO kinase 1
MRASVSQGGPRASRRARARSRGGRRGPGRGRPRRRPPRPRPAGRALARQRSTADTGGWSPLAGARRPGRDIPGARSRAGRSRPAAGPSGAASAAPAGPARDRGAAAKPPRETRRRPASAAARRRRRGRRRCARPSIAPRRGSGSGRSARRAVPARAGGGRSARGFASPGQDPPHADMRSLAALLGRPGVRRSAGDERARGWKEERRAGAARSAPGPAAPSSPPNGEEHPRTSGQR